jgi:hypothetical protein
VVRVTFRILGLAGALATAGAPVTLAQTPPAPPSAGQPAGGQPAGGQPAGSEAQERARGPVAGWLWPILGLAVIGGAVAAASGGGGGGGGGSSAPTGTQ